MLVRPPSASAQAAFPLTGRRRLSAFMEVPVSADPEKSAAVMELLDECRHWWEARSDFRNRRKRARQYYRGKQWAERVEDRPAIGQGPH